MLITANPMALLTQTATFGAAEGGIPAGIGGAGVLRFVGGENGDTLRVSGALSAPELMPGAVLGAALTAEGSLDAMMPFGAKARVEFATDMSTPSPALAGYSALLEKHRGALGELQSNVDESQFTTPESALEFLRSLKSDEFVFGAQVDGKSILWRGSEAQLPAGVAEVVRGADALFGTLA